MIVGTEGDSWISLIREGNDPLYLVGEFQSELRRLAGADVLVDGYLDMGAPGNAINVQSYEILSIDGERPLVGIVEVREGSLWIRMYDGELLELVGLDDAAVLSGDKVWAVGELTDSSILVQSYGVIQFRQNSQM